MNKTLKEIAQLIDGEVVGNENVIIRGVSGIKEAVEGDIIFVANPKYLPLIDKTGASAIITSQEVKSATKPIIRTQNPSLAFTKVISFIKPSVRNHPKGVHPSAILGRDTVLGKNVAIGPYVVLGDKVSIGDNSIIYAGSYIGDEVKVGSDVLINANVSIRERVVIGDRVVINSGTVIGSDGFGFIAIEGRHHRIPQVGTVIIEDDVEIGSNVTIDRARFDKTLIGKGTKIDNLVHIAHNVVIGENSIIIAQVGISGSATIGKNVILAGQSGVVGHVTIGDGTIVAAGSGVSKSLPPNIIVWGYPAKPERVAKRVNACVQNLPRLYKVVSELKNKIAELERKLKNG